LGPADAGSSTNVPEPSLLPDPKDKIEEQNLLHLAMMAAEDSRPDDAQMAFEKVLQLDPNSQTALRQLGELELRAAKYDKAAAHLKRAHELRPEDAATAFLAGQALEKFGDLPGAREALESSVKLAPAQAAEARVLLGQVYLRLKDTKAAADQFEAVLLMKPENTEAGIGLARVQMNEGNYSEALKQLVALSQSNPKNADVFQALAQAYSGLGNKIEADRAQRRAELLLSHGKAEAKK
jgi:predicted Zn-dependent protease